MKDRGRPWEKGNTMIGILVGMVALSAMAVAGEGPSLSSDGLPFRVNTAGDNTGGPCLAMGPAGNLLVAWTTYGPEREKWAVFGKRYDPKGQALPPPAPLKQAERGNEFQLNSHFAGVQAHPRVAMDRAGSLVAVWGSGGQDGDRGGIFAKRYDRHGGELPPPMGLEGTGSGNEFRVNQETRDGQYGGAVAVGPDGGFMVAWRGRVFPKNQGGLTAVLGRCYDVAAGSMGPEFTVEIVRPDPGPALAAGADGSYLVAWSGEGEHVWGRRYGSSCHEAGTREGLEEKTWGDAFQVSSYNGSHRVGPFYNPHGAVLDRSGGALIVFESVGQGGVDGGVFAKRYDGKGDEVVPSSSTRGAGDGNEFQVNSREFSWDSFRAYPPLAAAAVGGNGNFVIVWSSMKQDGDESGVFAKAYDRYGNEIAPPADLRGSGKGNEFQVNVATEGNQGAPDVGMDEDGDIIIAWTGKTDGNDSGIFARRYSLR